MHTNCDCDNSWNCTVFNGNSVDINMNNSECEIRADVVLSEYKAVRLWGRVVNCEGKPIENALIKLIKIEYDCNHEYYKGIAHTTSDCEGFYQFELCNYDDKSKYKLLVNKVTYGSDTIIPIELNECSPCEEPNPCNTDCYKHKNSNLNHTANKCSDYDKYEVNYTYENPKYYSFKNK